MSLRAPSLRVTAVALGTLLTAGLLVSSGVRESVSPQPAAAVEHPALGLVGVRPSAPKPAATARAARSAEPANPVVGSLGDELRAAAAASSPATRTSAPPVAVASTPAASAPAAAAGPTAAAAPAAAAGPTAAAAPAAIPAPALQPADLLGGGIPTVALAAYVHAAESIDRTDPGCHVSWAVLAGLGRVESNHGRFGGAVLDTAGRATPPIIGPRLDGTTYASVPDTDHGRLDGDTAYDRAVGPMQFLPSTWARWGRDADGDGIADPQDINDAAAGAAAYLCGGGGDLRTGPALGRALWRYNQDASYVQLVAGVAVAYANGRR